MLERVLGGYCEEQGVSATSLEASDAATALVELYRCGIGGERQLGLILRPRLSYLRALERRGAAD